MSNKDSIITKISIYDSNSCTTTEKTLTTPIVIPAIEEIKIVASSTDSDCESGVSGTITFEKAGTAFTSAQQAITQIKIELQGVSAQTIYKTWSEISGGSGSQATISSLPTYGTYIYEITTNVGSNTCNAITGSVEVVDNTFKLNFDNFSPAITLDAILAKAIFFALDTIGTVLLALGLTSITKISSFLIAN